MEINITLDVFSRVSGDEPRRNGPDPCRSVFSPRERG